MEDDDSFFAGDDDFVWPESSFSGELSDHNVEEITMVSVPSTLESNCEVENLGFTDQRKVEDNVDKGVEEENKNKELMANLTEKISLIAEDDSDEVETVKEGEKNEVFKGSTLEKASKLSPKSRLMVEDENEEVEIVNKDDKKEGFRVNLVGSSSKLGANSSLKVEDKNMEKQKKKQGLRVTKAPKSKSKFDEKASLSAMECLIEMLKHICEIDKRGNEESVDILETVKRRGMTFPRPRGYDS